MGVVSHRTETTFNGYVHLKHTNRLTLTGNSTFLHQTCVTVRHGHGVCILENNIEVAKKYENRAVQRVCQQCEELSER